MLCKFLRKAPSKGKYSEIILRNFSSSEVAKNQSSSTITTSRGGVAHDIEIGRKMTSDIENSAYMEYKQYPLHISHWNPDSPDYVESPREEDFLRRQIDGFNDVIDNLKNCIKLQEELYDAVERMDRPYLTSGKPGLSKNVYAQVQDYSSPTGHNYMNPLDVEDRFLQDTGGNIHRYIRNAPFHVQTFTPSNILQWQQEVDERPVNDHYNADKGYKFDVAVPYEERHPHLADRLGRPYILGDPLDRLFRLEQDIYHPNYLDQPFVQTPPVDADADVNFSEGEVIYENVDTNEWANFWQRNILAFNFFNSIWVPYHFFVKNNFMLSHMKEGITLKFFETSSLYFDNYGISFYILPAIIYYFARYSFLSVKQLTSAFVCKMQYNQDKDILFLTIPGSLGETEEVVLEMDHVEIAPASFGIGNAFLSANQADGYYTITDLNQRTTYHVRKDAE